MAIDRTISYLNVLEFDAYIARILGNELEYAEQETPRRYLRDLQNPLEFYNNAQFKLRYHFEKETIIQMMSNFRVEEKLQLSTNRGLPIPPLIQLLTAIRFFATGSFQTDLGDLQHISRETIITVLHRMTVIIAEQFKSYVAFPSTREGMLANRVAFYEDKGFPGVSGVIDCTHIAIENPGGPFAEDFRNRKQFYSINVQVVSGPHGEILDFVARWPGSTPDVQIFDRSVLKMKYESGLLTECLVADSAYPCLPYMLTPLLATHTVAEKRYNLAHKRVWNIVECCIGTWKRRLLCLKNGLKCKPNRAADIISACAVLHNFAFKCNDEMPEGDIPERVLLGQRLVQPHKGQGAAFRRGFIARHFE